MVKNKLETLFSNSMRDQFAWGIKLHNNMLAHQTTPADYIVSMNLGNITSNHKFMLVECKQVTCKDRNGRLAFKRLKQMHDLQTFEQIHGVKSAFFCIAYWDGRWTNSEVYLVPVSIISTLIETHNYKSLNRADAMIRLNPFKLEIKGGVLQLQKLLKSI